MLLPLSLSYHLPLLYLTLLSLKSCRDHYLKDGLKRKIQVDDRISVSPFVLPFKFLLNLLFLFSYYFILVDTRAQNPSAVWVDPRIAPQGNRFAPPPPDDFKGNQYQPPQQQQQYNQAPPQQQQQQQQYNQGPPPPQQQQAGGFMGQLNGFIHPNQQQQGQGQGQPPSHHGLTGTQMALGGLGALAVAGIGYEVYEHEEHKGGNQHQGGEHHRKHEERY